MSTKPDTDTGWSKELPPVGTYWLRSVCNPASAVVVVILGDYIKFTSGTSERFSPKAGYEFLGPISPSDFEQLRRLCKAAEKALMRLEENESWWKDLMPRFKDTVFWRATFEARYEACKRDIAALREALAPINSVRGEKQPQ